MFLLLVVLGLPLAPELVLALVCLVVLLELEQVQV
jgi:hypothetical protein